MYVVSGPSRPSRSSCSTMPKRPAIRPIADVHGDRDAELAGQLPLGLDHLVLGEPGSTGGQRHRDQPVVAGDVRRPDPTYVVAGDRLGAEEPVLLQRGVGAAVGVLRADPGLLQPLDRGVGVLGGVVDVRPVDERRDAGVEALQRAGQVAGVDVLGPVERREGVEHLDEVVVEGGVRRAVADRRLPRVPVGVDEARDDDLAGAVDDLGVGVDVSPRRRRSCRPRSGRRRWRGRRCPGRPTGRCRP